MSSKHSKKRKKDREECESYFERESESGKTKEIDKSMALPHAEKDFRQAWVGAIQRNGTTKLPKKAWMDTHCMKLNSKQNTVALYTKHYTKGCPIRSVMMHGTNMPRKQRKKDAVDSICRTSGCIIPDHHRWLLKSEKVSRECCGSSLMCSTCHADIPFPCSHYPPCEWRVISKNCCSNCKLDANQAETELETVGSNNNAQEMLLMDEVNKRSVIASSASFTTSKENSERRRDTEGHERVGGCLYNSNAISPMDKNFHKAWVRVIHENGTTKLPKKPWMKTCCMKLQSKQVTIHVPEHGAQPPPVVMMRGTNMPRQPKIRHAIDSMCRTPDCIIPNHHHWISIEEKRSRQFCGSDLMCPTCSLEIPFPCVHNPPCEWEVVAKEGCLGCRNKYEE
ncbi:unknown protein [Seminavis robusta]|uniref:Uncharacterized protein n=1 Tax=Seminavis robusta TaxID=568900 RepID=A0A9N8HE91_9STRA|nr:unknown protein [Seminavis robusta]|eukprot:Sro503_g155841.1  (394) ;mRNA; f:41768-42949